MMKQTGDRWSCLPCHVKPLPLGAEGHAGRSGLPMWVYGVIFVVLAAIYVIPRVGAPQRSNGLPQLITEAAEPWSKMPVEQWPRFILANEFELQGVPKSKSGSGFLIDRGDGQIVGATHAEQETLGKKANDPNLTIGELNQRIVSWRMFTPEAPDHAIAFGGFFGAPTARSDGDVWLLRPASEKAPLPVTPLKLRYRAGLAGMHLFVIARLPGEPVGKERAFPCTAQDLGGDGDLTKIAYDTATVSRGVAGAPVVDTYGHLAGIVTGIGDEEMNENSAVIWLKVIGSTSLQRLTP